MSIKQRLAICARTLFIIDAFRSQRNDPSIFRWVEREILDRELKDLASEWMLNPESPAVPNIERIR
jgi:hypothetical protein